MAWLQAIWNVTWKLVAFLIVWAIPLALLIVPFQSNFEKNEPYINVIQGSWLAALNTFEAGILFRVAYVVSRNLWLPIAIHFAWNFMLGPVLGLSVSGQNPFPVTWQLLKMEGPSLLTGGNFGLEGSIIVTVTTAMIIGSLILSRRYLITPPEE